MQEKWDFPNYVGALDGKHINIKCPKNTGSYCFICIGTFSVVLLGLVHADYKFIYVDVGCNGRIRDDGVFRNTSFFTAFEKNSLSISATRSLPVSDEALPFVVAADDAFPLKIYLIKLYPHRHLIIEQQNFNYQLSRIRRPVKNAFGILASRFRLFFKTIILSPDNTEKVVLASCTLHNYLQTKARNSYTPPSSVDTFSADVVTTDGDWRDDNSLNSIPHQGINFYSKDSQQVQEGYCSYFNSSSVFVNQL